MPLKINEYFFFKQNFRKRKDFAESNSGMPFCKTVEVGTGRTVEVGEWVQKGECKMVGA